MDNVTLDLDYPPYASVYHNKNQTVFISGGGGTAKTGVSNKLQAYHLKDGSKLQLIKSIQTADSVMWMHLDNKNNRLFFLVGNHLKSLDLSLISNQNVPEINHFDFKDILHADEFITSAASKDLHCSSIIFGTNQGRIYHLESLRYRCYLLRQEKYSIECVAMKGFEKFLVSYSTNIDEFKWSSNNLVDDESVTIFSSKVKGKVKRIICLADSSESVIFLFNNKIKSVNGQTATLRDYGSTLSTCSNSQILIVGMLNGFISLHNSYSLQQLNIFENKLNCPVTSAVCINDYITGAQILVTFLNNKVQMSRIDYSRDHKHNTFTTHIFLMITVMTLHMIFVIFYRTHSTQDIRS